jgi:hypothetical protein
MAFAGTSTHRAAVQDQHEQGRIGRFADVSEQGPGERAAIFLVWRFRARDYERLKRAVDDLQPLRERHGALGHRILRLTDDQQDYMVIIEFASFGGAKGFREEPLLLRAIDAAGVEGGAHHVQYVVEFREQLEAVNYAW